MWFSLPAPSFQTAGRYNWIHFYFNYNSLALKNSPVEICKLPQMPPFRIPWILMWPGQPSARLRPPATIDVCCYRPKVFPKQKMNQCLPFLLPLFYFSFWSTQRDLSEFAKSFPSGKIGDRRKAFVMNDSRGGVQGCFWLLLAARGAPLLPGAPVSWGSTNWEQCLKLEDRPVLKSNSTLLLLLSHFSHLRVCATP